MILSVHQICLLRNFTIPPAPLWKKSERRLPDFFPLNIHSSVHSLIVLLYWQNPRTQYGAQVLFPNILALFCVSNEKFSAFRKITVLGLSMHVYHIKNVPFYYQIAKMLSYEWLFIFYQIHFMHLLNDHKIVLFILFMWRITLFDLLFFLGGYPFYWIFSPLEVIIQIVNSWHSRGRHQ